MPFKKGEINNPKGRPKGTSNKWSIEKLQCSLAKAAALNNDVDFLDHICQKAYSDNALAIMIMKKLLPDLKQIEAVIAPSGYWASKTPDECVEDMDNATLGEKDSE